MTRPPLNRRPRPAGERQDGQVPRRDQVPERAGQPRHGGLRQPEKGVVQNEEPRGRHEAPPEGDHLLLAAGEDVGPAVLTVGLFLFIRSERRRDQEFLSWLSENSDAIDRGGARYRDALITPETRVTR